ncbi:MAG: ParB/RepB/Spo0J family partition protein [Oscillospiraceae bacterium]|jgi:ParB family chromosome partitioning protein|nr:ParB/RepB/Spo0J family partition protein [Oscillospiraceae bacterium]
MAKKSGLGNVLDSIFDDNFFSGDDAAGKNITTLKIGEVEPNRSQPRKHFDNEKLTSLADSITVHGIIQPITVRPYEGSYQIVAGERRWRAARMAGLTEVPVLIVELDDSETMQIALIENLQREDLNPLEEAGGYSELIEKFNMKQEDVAKKVGKARSSITNSLRLLTLPDSIKELVKNNELSKGHCKVLLGLSDTLQMIQLADKTVNSGLSVHALEKLIKSQTTQSKQEPSYKKKPLYAEAEVALKNSIGKTVRINEGKNNKVTIEIDVYSEDEVMDIVNRLSDRFYM